MTSWDRPRITQGARARASQYLNHFHQLCCHFLAKDLSPFSPQDAHLETLQRLGLLVGNLASYPLARHVCSGICCVATGSAPSAGGITCMQESRLEKRETSLAQHMSANQGRIASSFKAVTLHGRRQFPRKENLFQCQKAKTLP